MDLNWRQDLKFGYTIELRLDAPDGKKLATFDVAPGNGPKEVSLKPVVAPVDDGKMHNLYFVSVPKDPKEDVRASITNIHFR